MKRIGVLRVRNSITSFTLGLLWIAVLACLVFVFVYPVEAQINPVVPDIKPEITYTPPGQIEWVLNGSNGDEIITVKKINSHNWDFLITPNPSRLSSSEIKSYPLQSFYWYTSGTNGDDHIKVNTDPGLVRFYTIPDDTETLSTQITDKTVDLSKNRGVRVTINDPRWMDYVNLHIGVHSATYTAVSNLITVTGSPVTYQDVYDALIAVMPGTSPFYQLGTHQFFTKAKIDYGNDVRPTFLDAKGIQLSFSDGIVSSNGEVVQNVHTNAVVRLRDCSIVTEEDTFRLDKIFMYSGGSIRFLNTHISKDDNWVHNDRAQINGFGSGSFLRNCIFHKCMVNDCEIDITNQVIDDGYMGVNSLLAGSNLNDVLLTNNNYGVALTSSGILKMHNIDIRNATDKSIYIRGDYTGTATFVNCTTDDNWAVHEEGVGPFKPFFIDYTVDLTVTTDNGTPIAASVNIKTGSGVTVYSGVTSVSSGTIPTQNIEYGYYDPVSNKVIIHPPHTLNITASGYLDYNAIVTIDEAKDLEITLCQLSSGTTAGDVMSWLRVNDATITWWEDNMELLVGILLVLVLLAFAFWRGEWWIYVISSLVAMGWGFYYCGQEYPYYGYPLIFFGFAVFFHGGWLLFGTSKRRR